MKGVFLWDLDVFEVGNWKSSNSSSNYDVFLHFVAEHRTKAKLAFPHFLFLKERPPVYLIQLEFNKIHQYNDKQLKKLVSIDGESYVYLRNLQAVAKIKGATYTVATNNQKIYLKDWAYFIQGIYAQRKETINQIRDLKN